MMLGAKNRFYRKNLAEARGYAAGRAGRSSTSPNKHWYKGWKRGQCVLYSLIYSEQEYALIERRMREHQAWLDNLTNIPSQY